MLKIKHQRTADCVVAGFRWHKNGPGTHVGSLLLGLFDDEGKLHHVGVTSSFTWDKREALVDRARAAARERPRGPPVGRVGRVGATGAADASGQRLPGATSRWNRGKDLSWEPLRAGARRRGRLRPPPGRSLPARHDVRPLARRTSSRPTAATTSSRRRRPTRSRRSSGPSPGGRERRQAGASAPLGAGSPATGRPDRESPSARPARPG